MYAHVKGVFFFSGDGSRSSILIEVQLVESIASFQKATTLIKKPPTTWGSIGHHGAIVVLLPFEIYVDG